MYITVTVKSVTLRQIGGSLSATNFGVTLQLLLNCVLFDCIDPVYITTTITG